MNCITIDGTLSGSLDEAKPMFAERPGNDASPIWILCEVLLACGEMLKGGVRISPPRREAGAVPRTVPSGIIANIGGADVDILSGSERARASLLAHQVLPLRIRLAATPPIPVTGLHPDSPSRELEAGEWSRPLSPADMCCDLTRLTMPGFRAR